jgi:hypothetical protein
LAFVHLARLPAGFRPSCGLRHVLGLPQI